MPSDDTSNKYDYGQGLLTVSQREYLSSESGDELSPDHERTIRSRIRDRLANGIDDLSSIAYGMESRDFDLTASKTVVDPNFLYSANRVLLELLLRDDTDQPLPLPPNENTDLEGVEQVTEYLEFFLSNVIKDLYVHAGMEVENVDVNIELTLADDMSEKDYDLTSTSRDKLFQLFEAGVIDSETLSNELDRRR